MTTRYSVYNGPSNRSGRTIQGGGIFLILLGSLFFFFSCKQSPIFFSISQEVKLREPLIKGTPTNIVEWNDGVYVANFSSLYCYKKPAPDQNPVWVSIENLPKGQIWGLAATDEALYLLTSNGLSKKAKSSSGSDDAGPPWQEVSLASGDAGVTAYPSIQNIYGNSKRLFAGTYRGEPGAEGTDYAILYDDNGTLRSLKTGVHLLSGAAFDGTRHYIATDGSGIFPIADSEFSASPGLGDPIPNSGGDHVKGIIYCGADVVAVDRGGAIIVVTASGITVREQEIGQYTRNAFALWRAPPLPDDTTIPADPGDPDYPDNKPPQLLLAGIQGSRTSTTQSYTNGYREIVLDGTGALPDPVTVYTPGESPTPSISSREKYLSSLGQYPLNYLFQVPYKIDKNMPIFAAVHGEQGLWSYRDHGDGDVVWNAE